MLTTTEMETQLADLESVSGEISIVRFNNAARDIENDQLNKVHSTIDTEVTDACLALSECINTIQRLKLDINTNVDVFVEQMDNVAIGLVFSNSALYDGLEAIIPVLETMRQNFEELSEIPCFILEYAASQLHDCDNGSFRVFCSLNSMEKHYFNDIKELMFRAMDILPKSIEPLDNILLKAYVLTETISMAIDDINNACEGL